eukprot:scaffold45648_cov64-Phaeocystis_antarctica.AAC.1
MESSRAGVTLAKDSSADAVASEDPPPNETGMPTTAGQPRSKAFGREVQTLWASGVRSDAARCSTPRAGALNEEGEALKARVASAVAAHRKLDWTPCAEVVSKPRCSRSSHCFQLPCSRRGYPRLARVCAGASSPQSSPALMRGRCRRCFRMCLPTAANPRHLGDTSGCRAGPRHVCTAGLLPGPKRAARLAAGVRLAGSRGGGEEEERERQVAAEDREEGRLRPWCGSAAGAGGGDGGGR